MSNPDSNNKLTVLKIISGTVFFLFILFVGLLASHVYSRSTGSFWFHSKYTFDDSAYQKTQKSWKRLRSFDVTIQDVEYIFGRLRHTYEEDGLLLGTTWTPTYQLRHDYFLGYVPWGVQRMKVARVTAQVVFKDGYLVDVDPEILSRLHRNSNIHNKLSELLAAGGKLTTTHAKDDSLLEVLKLLKPQETPQILLKALLGEADYKKTVNNIEVWYYAYTLTSPDGSEKTGTLSYALQNKTVVMTPFHLIKDQTLYTQIQEIKAQSLQPE